MEKFLTTCETMGRNFHNTLLKNTDAKVRYWSMDVDRYYAVSAAMFESDGVRVDDTLRVAGMEAYTRGYNSVR